MRLLLALLAVLALLANPVTAGAAQVACTAHGDATVMSRMDMAGMPGISHATPETATTDPCCDHSAAACAVIVALPSPAVSVARYATATAVRPTSMTSRASQAPARLERPPRSIG